MRKNLLAIGLLAISFSASAQYLTYVGDKAEVYVNDGALVYNGGGLKVVGTETAAGAKGIVKNYGDIMIVNDANATTASEVRFDTNSDLTLAYGKKDASDATARTSQKNIYGQLYIAGIPQNKIFGKVNKEYIADVNHSNDTGGSQQLGLPFFEFTLGDLDDAVGNYLNITNGSWTTAGRWAHNSVHRWNNSVSRFDQVFGSTTTKLGKPTDYFIVPRRNSTGTSVWTPGTDLKTFKGKPVSDEAANTEFLLQTTTIANFGTNGSGVNWYRELYNSYLNDPFETVKWGTNYAQRMSQFANPFLTNLDLYNLAKINLTNVEGIAYYGDGSLASWKAQTGTTYTNSTMIMIKTSGTAFQAGPTDPNIDNELMIKPLGEVAIKFTNGTIPTVKLNDGRKFAEKVIANPVANPTGKMTTSLIAPDKLVKQVAVLALDANNNVIGRTYYAVSPSSVTGNSPSARLQGSFENATLFTKEEIATGGADANSNAKLYINEANEVDYFGKEIPLVVNSPEIKSFKFLVYEGGLVVDKLTSGNNFYISKDNVITKLNTGDTMSVSTANYNLYYGNPSGKGLVVVVPGAAKTQTVIAKKDNDWVVRFADNWKSANVEIYSAAGQLLHSAANVSTASDYVIPFNNRANGLYLVKTTSDSGEVVVKKIVK